MKIFLYLFVIVAANFVTAEFAPFTWGVFIVPCGTLLVGLTFLLRDFIQEDKGKAFTIKLIAAATVISLLMSVLSKDLLVITLASAASFTLSELLDTEIFSRMKGNFKKRVIISGLFGGLTDSVVFVVVGLSPLFTNILPWKMVFFAVLGQFVFKFVVQLSVILIKKGRK